MFELRAVNDTELPDKPVKKWRAKFETSNLSHMDFVQFFQTTSPYFVIIDQKPENSELGNCSFDEQGSKHAIIDSLEEFICGDNPQAVLERLKSEDNVPSVCGRVFKIGEPTYSCRECSMDGTCVLCSSCFKKSPHRLHKYKMSTSNGGGCCDCGDKEAWKRDPFCEDHDINNVEIADSAIITDKMKQYCQLIFKGVLYYCMKSLQIPSDASIRDMDETSDVFCTILYNDETHTFEQVIGTLTSIVKCSQKEAIEYVTSIDREGRAVVKCATFDLCKKLKDDIEHKAIRSSFNAKSSPLKVTVLHKKQIAYQHFAMQLLSWFQDFLTKHSTFRSIFCDTVCETGPNNNLKQILSYDHKLWKSARTSWHRLLISGMLMEYDNKKNLAVMFTKLYSNLMQEFIRDDHYHSFSIVSLSVQLFTVPTIAHHLIAHELAFFKLMHTFYSECIDKYVKNKLLQFDKNTSTMNVFKRAAYILIDLKYLLSFKPDIWTQELRTGFLHGVQILIRLLKCMQGMDAVTRHVGQHMEYEPEWETAFTLHLKLSHLITLVLDWCSTDKVVLVKVYRMLLTALTEIKFIVSEAKVEVKELADHSASCLMYDVAAKPVSIHLPLTRFLSGLYVHFEKFDLTFDTISSSTDKPTPEQIIEPVLCTRTMISQVYAGMWRRNGYSLLNQLYFYRNVKCRFEMLDRDVIILQIGASLIESNEFLIHVLNKFNLINWTNEDYEPNIAANPEEDGTRQVINMVDELLELLIIIIGERYVPGIGVINEDDRIKKEIMQQLCIKPYSHSELNRALNEDFNSETGMENVIEEIAIFEKPTQSDKKGVYKLNPEYYEGYNMYFYHYTKEDKSKSEETQRKRRKEKNELVCCPPPKLPQLTQSFSMLTNLLQSDVMLLIMQTVLKRSLDLKAISFSESHLQKILHLIGYGIQEEESNNYPFLKFVERATKWDLLQLMEELVNSARVESQRDLLLWTIKKFKELQSLSNDKKSDEEIEVDDQTKSSMTSIEAERVEKEERAKMAAKRREQILAQMQNAQKNFMSSNAEMFEKTSTSDEGYDKNAGTSMEWQPMEEESEQINKIACMGPNRKVSRLDDVQFTCILCSEDSAVSNTGSCLVYSAFIQKSSVLSRYQQTNESGQLQYLETSIHPSPHINTCGHVMHVTCWEKYFNNEVIKETRRPYRNRTPVLFDLEKKEFLCPLCRFLSNSVLPLLPALTSFSESASNQKTIPDLFDFDVWYDVMNEFTDSLHILENSEMDENTDDNNEKIKAVEEIYANNVLKKLSNKFNMTFDNDSEGSAVIGSNLEQFVNIFCESVRSLAPYPATSKDFEEYLVTWMSCAYTIESLEMLLRATEKPLSGEISIRYTSCLSGLVRLSGVVGTNIKTMNYSLLLYVRHVYDTLFGKKKSSFLEWDIFGMMVTLIFATRCAVFAQSKENTIPKGSMLEYTIFKSLFLAKALKIICTYEFDGTSAMDTDDFGEDSSVGDNLYNLYAKYNIYLDKHSASGHKVTRKQLVDVIKKQSQTFLRCSCLLFNCITDVELPSELSEISGDTFEVMAGYLGLDTDILSYFNNDIYLKFLTKLVENNEDKILNVKANIKNKSAEEIVPIISTIPPIRQLIDLPDDYSDLINSVSLFTCPNNERDDSRNPTMCLVCGEILCSQSYCCQKELDKRLVGACTYHVHTCGAGIGIFLRIRDSEILLLGINKGCFMAAPYLDEYGETDQGLRRGNPLRLCKERYKKLHITWLSHGIHEEITRKTENQQTLFATQWHHL